ncbi:MAG: hypothetical protein ABS55_12885 [Lautropia sp. SCN 70-15]|nr:MAG: hypothetical protein ABS55_12885 [Lautropia sp. SCN 70-15]
MIAETDRLLLERILRNLIDNAVKYTDKGEIRLVARRQGTGIRIAISDTGPGIPVEEQDRVFEEFYQIGNRERDRRKGLGLGLSIVRRLVDMLGVEMRLESAMTKGTRFELELPLRATGGEVEGETTTDVSAIAGLSILVVDDEASVRLGMKTLLEGLDCRVTLAASTAEAVDSLGGHRPDIVLADMRLRGDDNGLAAIRAVHARYPGVDIVLADMRLRGDDNGLAAIRAVHARYPGVPALLISGDTAPDRLRDAAAAGVPMLHKPVPADVLRRSISEATRRNAPARVGSTA